MVKEIVVKKKSHKLLITTLLSVVVLVSIVGVIMINERNPQVLIETSMGNITLELYPKEAPITVKNFLEYVDAKFYDNMIFHRVIEDFMIQGGGFYSNGVQKRTNAPIKLESQNGLDNEKGTVAMARTNLSDSATSQFFINLNDNEFLNYGYRDEGYAVFGKVIDGMDIVEKIGEVETDYKYGTEDWPVEDITIKTIKRI